MNAYVRRLCLVLFMLALMLCCHPALAALQGWWKLDESDGTSASDASGNSNTGTLTDMAVPGCWIAGQMGNALSFDGSNDKVTVPSSASLNNIFSTDAFTYTAWIYPKASSGDIMGFTGYAPHWGYSFTLMSGKLCLRFQNAAGTWILIRADNFTIPLNQWSHVAVTYDPLGSGQAIFYRLDNDTSETESSTVVADSTGSNFWLGRQGWTNFNGYIDEAKAYDHVLTAEELQGEPPPSDLQAWWELNESGGTSASDSSGNSNTGTLVNMTAPGCWVAGQVGNALSFDGSNDYVGVAASASLNSILSAHEFTYAAWIYPKASTGDIMGFAGYAPRWGYSFTLMSGKLSLRFQNAAGTWSLIQADNLSVPLNDWSHVAVTYDPSGTGQAIFYLDDSSQTKSSTVVCDNSGVEFRLGRQGWSYFNGYIDEARAHNRVLNESEIHDLANPDGGGEAPAAPTLGYPTPDNQQMTLSWNAVTGATSYTVYWGTSAGNYTGSQADITTLGYTRTGLANYTKYYFAVKAVNAYGSSGYSNEVADTPTKTGVTIVGDKFKINGAYTYSGAIEGMLMNSRMINGIFDDENAATKDQFKYPGETSWVSPRDPDRNTDEFIGQMDDWKAKGLLAFTIGLQGGSPYGYSGGAQTWINTAIAADGSLKTAFMDRLDLILRRADELGMVVILNYFYFGQDQNVNESAINTAVDNATHWVLDRGYRNVMIEVANESMPNVGTYWPALWPDNIDVLITRVKGITYNGRRLYASTSWGVADPPADAVLASDFVLIHGNAASREKMVTRIDAIKTTLQGQAARPIMINEDDHFSPLIVGHWKFDSNATDSSTWDRHGTVTGTSTWVAGQVGNALSLNGSTYVTVGTNTNILQNVPGATLSAWIKPTTLTGTKTIAFVTINGSTTYARAMLQLDGTNLVAKARTGGTSTTERTLTTPFTGSANAWTHVAVTIDYDGDRMTLYIGGQQAITATTSFVELGTVNTTSDKAIIGAAGNLGNKFTGSLDDVRIYSQALTGTEMASLFSSPTTFDPPCAFRTALANGVSWGFFDYRMGGETTYVDGFQSIPANWTINTKRKQHFFDLMESIIAAN